ncbi:MAG: Elongation factor 2 [Candidatus Woesearchaeota archaeon]|nr:Elongation factor 2 [Candidatus Woesearchaeota archaeon]
MTKEKMIDKVMRLMKNPNQIRNIGTVAHIDHGKTTFSDNLLAGSGMMSQDLAGKTRALDFHEDEAERGITIDAANVSMVHKLGGKEFLINLIDTPGHIDFSGDVTRAMRAVDGVIVLVCAVEGVMPQTETVLKQCLRERVKPILFINKVDRMIKELKLTPEQMQERFVKIIKTVNELINSIAEKQYKEDWQVNVNDGSVAFGSAYHNWALSFNFMKKSGMDFSDIIDAYKSGDKEDVKKLAEKAPIHEIILESVIKHHPDPLVSQKYRIPKIWRGDQESELGKALINCDPNGPLTFVCTKIVVDKHVGEVAAGRLFSGTVKQGDNVHMIGKKKEVRLQQVCIFNGAKRDLAEQATAGNIIGLIGLDDVFAGETVSSNPDIEPFESIKHIFDPVITKAIEPKKSSELPKLIEVLKVVGKEDPSIKVHINEESGEYLISGMGELHLEIIENRIRTEKNFEVVTSPPIVVYRETISKMTPDSVEGKSPNKHNKIYFRVAPIPAKIKEAIKNGELPAGKMKKYDKEVVSKLVECGMETKMARKVKDIYNGNIFINNTRGIVHIQEIMDMVLDIFEEIMDVGPISNEPCINVMVYLDDAKLHEDAIHRGPAQMYPAFRGGIRGAFRYSGPVLFEPKQVLQFEAPYEFLGDIANMISSKRGQLIETNQQGKIAILKGKLPVAEMFGLASDLRSITSGRGNYFLVDQMFERLPGELQSEVIKQIRERKGMKLD